MRNRWLLILAGLILAAVAACTSGGSDTPVPDRAEGVLAGSVTIGPLCPIEPCSQGIGDTYTSRELQLQSESADGIRIPLNPDGTFRALVPVGEYTVNVSNCDLTGCTDSLPVTIVIREDETFNLNIGIDTGIRTPVRPPDPFTQLTGDLRNAGADVQPGSVIDQPFFSVPGHILSVSGTDLQVFEFPTIEDARAAAAKVAPDGGSIGTSMVNWIASPHFYSSGTLIVLYLGDDQDVLALLEGTLGNQFAGRGPAPALMVPSHTDIGEEADLTARRELSARLGVGPADLELVYSRLLEFGGGSLGCPDAGVFYTQAIVPGYVLLYELNGVRYAFRVSIDGRVFTDCRGENNVAAPFRLADDIVNIRDAFQFAGGSPSHLGKEVVLQTRADAQAFLSASGGLVEIDLDRIDWDSEMLAGTVITGSGCSFEVVTTLVFVQHLGKTVDISVEAVQTGLCEKAWAVPVWLVLQEVPKDYSAGFILSFSMN